MLQDRSSDLEALNKALDALNSLQVAIQLVREGLDAIQRDSKYHLLHFDAKGVFTGMSWHNTPHEIWPAECSDCVLIQSHCEWLPKHVNSLWMSHAEADRAVAMLPRRLTDRLDKISNTDWVSSVRFNCLDKVLKWPGEIAPQTSWTAVKVAGTIPKLLRYAADYDPLPTWAHFERLIAGYREQLVAIRHAVQPTSEKENRSAPMSKTEMARRITGRTNARLRDVESILEQHDLKHIEGNKWSVRLDGMDAGTRKRLEGAE